MESTSQKKVKQPHMSIKKRSVLDMPEVPPGTFPVIDYESKILFIPLGAMVETGALHRDGVPSLCRIYMSGRCLQGSKCHQAHAEAKLVSELRAIALAEPSCCEKHGASSGNGGIRADFSFTVKDDKRNGSFYVGPQEYCITGGLQEILSSQTSAPAKSGLTVPFTSLCKLHSRKEGTKCCRFDSQCKFVHICRELLFAMEGCVLSPTDACVALPLHRELSSTNQFFQVFTCAKELVSDVKDRAPELSIDRSMNGSLDFNSVPSTQPDSLILLNTPPVNIRHRLQLPTASTMPLSHSSPSLRVIWRHNPYPSTLNLSTIET